MMRQSAILLRPLQDALMRRNSDANSLRSAILSSTDFRCRSANRHTSAHDAPFSADNRSRSRT